MHQAKDYLNRHASEVEQRLAQDRTFKGRLQTARIKFIKWIQVLFKPGLMAIPGLTNYNDKRLLLCLPLNFT